jgi:hypothetical protein
VIVNHTQTHNICFLLLTDIQCWVRVCSWSLLAYLGVTSVLFNQHFATREGIWLGWSLSTLGFTSPFYMFFLAYYPCHLSRSISYVHSSTSLLEPRCPSEHTGLYGLDRRGIGVRFSASKYIFFSTESMTPPPTRVKQTTHRNLVLKIKIIELYLYFPTRL